MAATRSYFYTIDNGWQSTGTEDFRVSDFVAAFTNTWKSPEKAPYTASLSVDASYTQSLLRFSESTLAFNLGLTFKLTDVVDLTFSSVSQNSSAWRYWPWLFNETLEAADLDPDSYFKDPVTDILEGFAFWSDSTREDSLFKLKSISVKLVRYLHDWDMSFSLTATTPTLRYDDDSLPIRPQSGLPVPPHVAGYVPDKGLLLPRFQRRL